MGLYYGYGINTSDDNFKLKPNAAQLLWEKAKDIDWFKESFETYCEDNDLDPIDNDSIEQFMEAYESDASYYSGFEVFLTDVINEFVNPDDQPFAYDDYCIFVPATIPINDTDKASMLTQEKIREILVDYVNPLIEEPVVVDWYSITD